MIVINSRRVRFCLLSSLIFHVYCVTSQIHSNSNPSENLIPSNYKESVKESLVQSDVIQVQPSYITGRYYPSAQYPTVQSRFCCGGQNQQPPYVYIPWSHTGQNQPQAHYSYWTTLGPSGSYGSGFGGAHRESPFEARYPYSIQRRYWNQNQWDDYNRNLIPNVYHQQSSRYPNYPYYANTNRYQTYPSQYHWYANPYPHQYINSASSPWERWYPNRNYYPHNPYQYNNNYWHNYYNSYRPMKAKAIMKGHGKIDGTVYFEELVIVNSQNNRHVAIRGRITGLTPGAHGFHILDKPAINGDCLSGGKHYNPQNSDHGGKADWVRHVGDLGNILADNHGVAYFDISDQVISLSGGYSVINRTLVITEREDDLGRNPDIESKTNGNSGLPVACGIIELSMY